MKQAVIFTQASEATRTHVKSINAIAEVDEFDSPFAAEVLWFKERTGEVDSEILLAALEQKQIPHNYSDEVDALTLSFGNGVQSFGQKRAVLSMEFNGSVLIGLTLAERE